MNIMDVRIKIHLIVYKRAANSNKSGVFFQRIIIVNKYMIVEQELQRLLVTLLFVDIRKINYRKFKSAVKLNQ